MTQLPVRISADIVLLIIFIFSIYLLFCREPDEYYKLFERYVELGDCPVNKKLGRTDGELCWEVDDCFSDTLG